MDGLAGLNIKKIKWQKRVDFYTFLACCLSKSDTYPPEDIYKRISIEDVKSCWKKTIGMIKKGKAPDKLGIQVYVPFCKTRCHFCLAYARVPSSIKEIENYMNSLIREIDLFKNVFGDVPFNSLYIGGGTPSYLSNEDIERIFEKIGENFFIKKDAQITFETSPYTLTYDKLRLLKKFRVNRITIGIQSMNKEVLKRCNRTQDSNEVYNAIIDARRVGIKSINVDFMPGLPGETLQSFIDGVEEIIKLSPDMIHLMPYFPSAETNFEKMGIKPSKKQIEDRFNMNKTAKELLKKSGYNDIEAAFFAKSPDARNIQQTDDIQYNSSILGFGPNSRSHAFGCLYYGNTTYLDKWEKPISPVYEGIKVGIKDEMRKYILSNLRRGISRKEFYSLFHKDITEAFDRELKELSMHGIALITEDCIKFNIVNRQEQLIFAKYWYDKSILEELSKRFKPLFSQAKDYREELNISIDKSI